MNEGKFIRILDGQKILKAQDNFKTFDVVDSISGYEVLKTRNAITEITLRYLYGEKKASILILELKKINKIVFNDGKKHDDGYGKAFEIFALSVLLDKTY